MQKLLTCFIALNAFFPAAFAADGAISRVLPGATGVSTVASDTAGVSARNVSAQTSSTTAAVTTSAKTAAPSGAASSRTAIASRVVSGAKTGAITDADVSRGTASSASATGTTTGTRVSRSVSAGTSATSAREKLDAAVNTVGRNARVSAAGINNNPTVRRSGVSLRPSTAEVGGRATIAGTDVQTGSNITTEARAVQSRASTTQNVTTRESIADAKERLEQTADLNKSCQEQYNDCMDQFCAVIDANQKRCSCSANLSRYTKVETAVKDANTQLNDVAQRIRYVGLSADEIRAIMSATEAEEALSGARDTTETRNMLTEIEKLIKDPTTTASGTDSYSTLDLDLDFTSDITDLFNLDFLNNSSGSMTNLRGTDLYNAAKKRCNTILTQCKTAGATEQQITANYDLAIDKDCIAYEQGLSKMNETLVSNVRSANLMLQKARMAVLQNKNQYDAKGCIAALDTCMTDEMVCGDGYLKCLDPTKKYIDENGNVVLGQNINKITDFMTNYNNANVDATFLSKANGVIINDANCSIDTADKDNPTDVGNNGACIVKYLIQKIGTGQNVADNGLCRAVLDKCQRYTYDSNGNYKANNDIVVNYIQRAMVNIQAGQQKAISDYASSCMLDLATCYNQQVTQVNTWTTSASVASVRNVMSGACRNVALTCAYAVFAEDAESCPTTAGGEDECINSVSDMFYQSLLCPDNSTYSMTKGTAGVGGYVNDYCVCNDKYEPWGSSCLYVCDDGQKRNSYGNCVSASSN